jgi:integrase
VVSLKPGPDGQRRRKKVSGRNKTEVRVKLAELHDELNDGVVTNAACTVAQAIKDWLADGLAGRAPKTVSTQREVLEPLIGIIGAVPLRELTAATVRSALKELAATRATRTVAMAHAGLTRAIRHAEANDKVRRNVATLVDTPAGQEGRPSKSLTFAQAVALIQAARSYGLNAYVVLSLLVGVRTEVAGRYAGITSTWRATRPPSRRYRHTSTSGAPYAPTETPRRGSPGVRWDYPGWRWKRSASSDSGRRLRAGDLWQDQGLVFTTAHGSQLDAADVRRSLRTICRRAGLAEEWTPRELRHTFVSLLSDNGMAIEEISRLVGHSSSNVTETVYRHQIRPVITVGAEAMDKIFASGQ